MRTPSPTASVASFDAATTRTGQEFTLAVTERRYRESLSLPSGATRDLRAFEYVTALEEALHGSTVVEAAS